MVASLILGSHAMHDTFAMIAWNAAGVSPVAGSVLWSESVAAEVIVFVAVGPFLLRRLTPEIAMVVAAVASLVRWGLLAESSNIIAIATAEPLHGLRLHCCTCHACECLRPSYPGTRGTCTGVYGRWALASLQRRLLSSPVRFTRNLVPGVSGRCF